MSDTKPETYIYDGKEGSVEIKLTGRKAIRESPGGKKIELVEVTPSDEYNGTWKQWTSFKLLYKIQE